MVKLVVALFYPYKFPLMRCSQAEINTQKNRKLKIDPAIRSRMSVFRKNWKDVGK